MSFANLKKASASSIAALTAAAEKLNTKQSYSDDRFWSPTLDKAGNGYAIIRFLPAPESDALPWVRFFDHGFKGPTGRWYIENSLTSIGKTDLISELNSKLWNSGMEKDKEIARSRKRRLHYVSNILVISDPGNPANDGKHFLFKYGKKIFEKIDNAMSPEFEDETPINPFDFWAGANFKLKIRQVEGYRNYDKSEFEKVTELFKGDDKRLEELYKELYPLADFVDPKNYKSYEELAAKLKDVLGDEISSGSESTDAPAPGKTKASATEDEGLGEEVSEDGGEAPEEKSSLSYFSKLAKE